jgi:hypothetical protein
LVPGAQLSAPRLGHYKANSLRVDSLRCLGVHIISGNTFRCNFDNAKKSFYGAFNAICDKISRTASEEVVLSLVKSNCLPCLLYGIDVIAINKTEMRSIDFPVMEALMGIYIIYI